MIGKNLKKIRLKNGLSINELSRMSEVNASYISAIERGVKNNPSQDILKKLSQALDVSINEFFKEDVDPKVKKFIENSKNSLDDNLAKQVKFIESLKLDTPEEALKFILKQPLFMAYGGYDLNKMTDDEIMDLANDMLLAMKISIEKMNRK